MSENEDTPCNKNTKTGRRLNERLLDPIFFSAPNTPQIREVQSLMSNKVYTAISIKEELSDHDDLNNREDQQEEQFIESSSGGMIPKGVELIMPNIN